MNSETKMPRYHRKTQPRTREIEVEEFKKIWEQEFSLYEFVLMNPSIDGYSISKLSQLLDSWERVKDREEFIAKLMSSLKNILALRKQENRQCAVSELVSEFYLIDPAKAWLDEIFQELSHLDSTDVDVEASPAWIAEFKRRYLELKKLKNHVVEANTGLVPIVANRWKNLKNTGVPYEDLKQEGMLGLIKAVDKFDYKKGFRFSTYATWWIQHSIVRSIQDRDKLIRIPVGLSTTKTRQVLTVYHNYVQEHGTPPDVEWLAEQTKSNVSTVKGIINPFIIFSLDAPLNSETETGWHDILGNNEVLTQELFQKETLSTLTEMIAKLSPREQEVIRLRFGFGNTKNDEETLADVGKKFSLSRERVRQIQDAVLVNLRKSFAMKNIYEFQDLL